MVKKSSIFMIVYVVFTPREVFAQVDAIKDSGLDVPQVTELAYRLRKRGLDIPEGILSTQELTDALKAVYMERELK